MGVHGKKQVFKLDTIGNVLTDISSSLTEVSLGQNADKSEHSGLGDAAKKYLMGQTDRTLSLSGKFNATVNTHLNAVLGQDGPTAEPTLGFDFEYGPAGSTAGSPKFTGKCKLTSYEISGSKDDAVTFSAEVQIDGDVTLGTY